LTGPSSATGSGTEGRAGAARSLLAIAPERFVRRIEYLANGPVGTVENVFDAVGAMMLGKAAHSAVTLFVTSDHLKSAAESTVATLRSVVPELRVVVLVPTTNGSARVAPHPLAALVDAVLFEPVSDAELRKALGDAIACADGAAPESTPGSATSGSTAPSSATPDSAASGSAASAAERNQPPIPREESAKPQATAAPPIDESVAAYVPPSSAPVPPPPEPFLSGEPLGDTDLIQEIMFGPDALAARALTLIREQTGWRDVQLVALDSKGDHAGAAVEFAGDRFGALVAPQADAAALREWANWLARWLALDRSYREFRHLTYRDDLTGAWNRRFFDAFLTQCIHKASERRRPITVMVFDLDHFKRYNDEFGHEAGDEILKETVRLLNSVVRKGDRVCRIGGDEFAVVFADIEGPREPGSQHPDSVEDVASRFQDQIAQLKFPKLGTEAPGTLSISAGLATYPWDGTNPADLLRKADELAMQSKRRGKNVITFGPGAAEACKRRPGDTFHTTE
jgi:diguanylate cyclase (GGDEF)-like protein